MKKETLDQMLAEVNRCFVYELITGKFEVTKTDGSFVNLKTESGREFRAYVSTYGDKHSIHSVFGFMDLELTPEEKEAFASKLIHLYKAKEAERKLKEYEKLKAEMENLKAELEPEAASTVNQ